ncbi:MAG TPA: site-specific integrase [Verrucomicrobiae bacterium]|nr:site-specific integrase [Verrucomicrobiae bacterium]
MVAGLDTGFRASELASLRWKDVDFKEKTVTVASCYTKNGDPRCIPMTNRLTEMMTILKGTDGVNGDAPVFGPYRYHKAFWKARDAAELGKDVVFHTLRHTFISRLVMAGVDLRTVKDLAGHRDIKMTLRYSHLAPEHKRKAIAHLELESPAEFPTVEGAAVASACGPVAQLVRAGDS